jgi:hypothetical protein
LMISIHPVELWLSHSTLTLQLSDPLKSLFLIQEWTSFEFL